MNRLVLLFASALAALVLCSGVALAMQTIQCKPYKYGQRPCQGTKVGERLLGTEEQDFVYALGGNDVLKGFGERDDLLGQRGNDRMLGGPGQDWLTPGAGNDTTVAGGEDHDVYVIVNNEWGHDTIIDEEVSDADPLTANIVRFNSTLSAGVTVDLASDSGPEPEVESASGQSTLNWSANAVNRVDNQNPASDHITGNEEPNRIFSSGDNDAATDDTVDAMGGNDSVSVLDGAGGDTVDCGEGTDSVSRDQGDVIVPGTCETIR